MSLLGVFGGGAAPGVEHDAGPESCAHAAVTGKPIATDAIKACIATLTARRISCCGTSAFMLKKPTKLKNVSK